MSLGSRGMADRAQRAEVSNDEDQPKRRLRGCLVLLLVVAVLLAVVVYVGVLFANGGVSNWLDCRQDPGHELCSPGCEPREGGGGC